MELKHSSKASKPSKDTLIVVLVSNNNRDVAEEFVTKSLGIDLSIGKDVADKGFQTFRFD